MNSHAPIVPIVLPALTAALMLLDRRIEHQRTLAWVSSLLQAGCALWLLGLVSDGTRLVYLLGNWPVPLGIPLVCDRLAAMMVALVALLALVTQASAQPRWDTQGAHFHPLVQVQCMGLNGAFLTGDLFNLFVCFEVLLIASYGLLLHGDGRARLRAGVAFVAINLLGSAIFLLGATLLYGVTGTLNLADLSVRMRDLPASAATLALIGVALLVTVFSLKAALLPLQLWLPASYGAACPPVAALFAIMTKVGVYALLRLSTLVVPEGEAGGPAGAGPWLAGWAALAYGLAMIGALAARDLRGLASMLLIGSAGVLLMGIGWGSTASLAAALFYLPHTTLAAAALYLLADLSRRGRGLAGDGLVPGPAMLRPALTGLLFVLTAVAVAGLPPLGGFIGKAMLLTALLPEAEASAGATGALWASLLVGSLFGLVALSRAGSVLFWKTESGPVRGVPAPALREYLPVLLLLGGVLALTLWAAPMQRFVSGAAQDLRTPEALVDAVLQTAPLPGPHRSGNAP